MSADFKYMLFSSINFVIFFGFLFFILKKPVLSLLKKRKEDYIIESDKGLKMKEEAEKNLNDVKLKLSNIKADGVEFLDKANKEGEDIGSKMLKNADAVALSIRTESKRLAFAELLYAVAKIKQDFVSTLIDGAEKELLVVANSDNMNKYVDECSSKIKRGELST